MLFLASCLQILAQSELLIFEEPAATLVLLLAAVGGAWVAVVVFFQQRGRRTAPPSHAPHTPASCRAHGVAWSFLLPLTIVVVT